MYKNITLTIKRLFISVLIFAMFTATVTSFAAVSVKTEDAEFELDEVPLGTSVTYDLETKEVYYGMGQDSETILSGEPTYVAEDSDIVPFAYLPTPVEPPIVGIVGDTDTRQRVSNTLDSPYRNVCFIEATFPDGHAKRGSGTLIFFNSVATAGHVIYSAENGGWAQSVTVIPALVSMTITEDGKHEAVTPLGMASSKRLTTNTGWIDHQKWDWGIIDLDKSFNTWQLFEVGSIATTKEVMSIGYPFDDKDFCMNYDVGNLISSSFEDFNFSNTIATGDSGGALIDTKTGKLIAILSKTAYNEVTGEVLYNNSVRINPDLYNRFVMHQNELKEEGY